MYNTVASIKWCKITKKNEYSAIFVDSFVLKNKNIFLLLNILIFVRNVVFLHLKGI